MKLIQKRKVQLHKPKISISFQKSNQIKFNALLKVIGIPTNNV